MNITQRRKFLFCKTVSNFSEKIAVVDVGSGGPLKKPWNLIPDDLVSITGFEPTAPTDEPLCISNHNGYADFFVAQDERSSSLHEVSKAFLERFGFQEMMPQKIIRIKCTTLDEYFRESFRDIDAIDINVEGHDFQVLQGAQQILNEGRVKLIKVEFELVQVYKGQGWFSDIDGYLRSREFELADLEIDYSRPMNVRSAYHKGEPLWGKALYVPSRKKWQETIDSLRNGAANDLAQQVLKSILLYVVAEVPGRALDLLRLSKQPRLGDLSAEQIEKAVIEVYRYANLDKVASYLRRGALSLLRAS